MKITEVTMKRDGNKYIVENNLGAKWEFSLKRNDVEIVDKAGFAQIAASMLTTTILAVTANDDEEITFTLSVK